MILIASMTQPERYRTSAEWSIKIRFEDITGQPALLRHYSQVTPQFVARHGFEAMFITGTGYGWELVPPKDVYGLNDALHEMEIPTLAACGGHQLLGFLFNRDVRKVKGFNDEPMRKLKPGEGDVRAEYRPGFFKEAGVQPVEIVKRDPIFKGLKKRFMVPEAHYCEVKKLPPGFIHLARNDSCELQCFRHADKPLYGAQFHAEAWTDAYPDGKTFITNFFRIAGLMK